ncbi:SHOCT domain-containing protein [Salinisphaera aquimarina]|uniref:SHOCT domain-containing protein n=1 Tax=Salinisphaera aquimarina TaxID=2094031 RepID=A0ABV7EN57_9GAMM
MQRKHVLAGMAIAALTAGCSALPHASGSSDAPPAYVNITRSTDLRVQLIPQGDAATVRNEHPAAFEPEQLQALLSSLRVTDEDGNAVTLASPSRLEKLGAEMSKAFVQAGPRQDVAFSVFRRSGGSIFTATRRVTSGRAFYRDNTVNIIFGEFDKEFSEFRDLSISPLKNGSREGSAGVDTSTLVASGSWHRHGNRSDWIELPATSDAIESAAAAAPTAIESSSSGAARPLRYGPAASAAASSATAPMPAQTTPSVPVPVESPAPAAASSASASGASAAAVGAGAMAEPAANRDWGRIEERLTQLKRLRDKNLITTEDYQNKKDALLQQLP